jgi:HAD superfamily hydrolase (TIGR01509 family)
MLHGKKPLAVASASELATIDLILGKLSLRDRFDAIASTEEVSRGKPAPDVFLLAAKRLGVAPEHCIVIEDAISGMTGAKAAGMRVIALWNHEPRELPADLVAKDLRDVPSEWFE